MFKFLIALLAFVMLGMSLSTKSGACLDCPSTCALLPPSNSSHFPCYQGTAVEANLCFDTDPLLLDGTTHKCGVCSSFGFPTYIGNDPIYKNMGLWTSKA